MTDAEIRNKTGWQKNYLRAVYNSASWDRIRVRDMDLFLWACGLHPSKQRRYRWVLQRAWRNGMEGIRKMKHLRIDAAWRSRQIDVLLRMVERVLNESGNESGV